MTYNEIINALKECEGCHYFNECEKSTRLALDLVNRQKAEIEDLEIKNEHLVCFLAEARKDAIKEFAERLKKDFYDLEFNTDTERKTVRVSELRDQMDWVLHTVSIEIINDLVREMIEEQGNDRLPIDKKSGPRN